MVFEQTEPNNFISMHIALDQESRQISSVDVRACKHNDRCTKASIWAVFWKSSTSPLDLVGANRALARTIFQLAVYFQTVSLRLGQEAG